MEEMFRGLRTNLLFMLGKDERVILFSSSAGSAIAGQFIDRMGSHGGFIVVTALALTSLAIALFGFKQIKDSTEQPMLTTVSV